MSKAVMYGMNKPYIPNSRADMRFRKKAYQRGRERAQRDPRQKKAVHKQKGDVNNG